MTALVRSLRFFSPSPSMFQVMKDRSFIELPGGWLSELTPASPPFHEVQVWLLVHICVLLTRLQYPLCKLLILLRRKPISSETRQKSLQNNRLPGLTQKANVLKVIHRQCRNFPQKRRRDHLKNFLVPDGGHQTLSKSLK